MKRRNMSMWYTFYDAGTDEVLAVGYVCDCAKIFGVKECTLYSMISRAKSGKDQSYTIAAINVETGKYVVYGAENTGCTHKTFDKNTAMWMYNNEASDIEIAVTTGVSLSTVKRWRRNNGLFRRPGRRQSVS